MIGTSLRTMGGISSVIRVYDEAGLLRRFRVRLLATHSDGTAATKLRMHLQALVAFLVLLARGRVGLLHVHSSSGPSFWRKCTFMLPAMALRVPVVLHIHSGQFDAFERELGPVRGRLVRWVLDHATVVVVLSSSWRRWVESVSTNQWVEVVPNPVLPEPQAPAAPDRNVVLALGRLGHHKGSYLLLEAAARLAERHRVSLRLAGDGDHEGVAARAAELGVDAEVLGWIGPEQRADELRRAGVFALPSLSEGLPMALLEAMAAGLPVVASSTGGIPEVVTHGVEGFLVAPGDVDDLTQRLGELLDDPDLAERMGAAARARAGDFSAEAVVPQVEKIYRTLGFEAR